MVVLLHLKDLLKVMVKPQNTYLYPPPGDTFNSYDNEDEGNPPDKFTVPPFKPSCPQAYILNMLYLGAPWKELWNFLKLLFSAQMVNEIVDYTNSYAVEHITEGSHRTYAQPDGSWKDTTADEIYRLIALLVYFGLVEVGMSVDKYWSTKTLYHGLWARTILTRQRFLALMALLHVVDPATEAAGEKLRKVESFINQFKSRCVTLYQPGKQVAIDERMVKSRHRSGLWEYIKDKPTRWGIKLWVLADSANGYTLGGTLQERLVNLGLGMML